MATKKSKRTKQASRTAARNAQLGETLKRQIGEAITTLDNLTRARGAFMHFPGDVAAIDAAIGSEMDHFRDLLAKFLTSRGIAVTTVEATPTQAQAA